MDDTIAAVSRLMVDHAVGSVIVVDAESRPWGIVTDRDLRERVLAASRPAETPVRAIASTPLVPISPEAFVLEALLEMTRRDIHHLAVMEAGRLGGVLSSHDLMLVQAAAPLELSRAIQSCASIPDLQTLAPELTVVVRQLFEQGFSGYEIGRIISEVNDMVIRRVLAITEAELRETGSGVPPAPFCWLVLGSEGRREQTIRTDQDNGLVYQDPPPGLAARAEYYFAVLAGHAIDALIRLGYPRCPGGSMASNPRWCQPLSMWRGYFAEWTRDTTARNLMYSSIYLDFRPVVGESRLAGALRDELRAQVKAWRSFPRYLAKIAVSHAPPLGLFGQFTLRREDGRRGINVKLGGMLILTNALRAYAIDLGLEETNTIERLEAAARGANCFRPDEVEDIREAYETVFRLRLRHQLTQLAAGLPPDNFVDPRTLSATEQRRLKDSFRAIRRLQGKLEDRYFTEAL